MMHNSPQGAMHNPMVDYLQSNILHRLDTSTKDLISEEYNCA